MPMKWYVNRLSKGSREFTIEVKSPDPEDPPIQFRITIFDLGEQAIEGRRFRAHVMVDRNELFRRYFSSMGEAKEMIVSDTKILLSTFLAELG